MNGKTLLKNLQLELKSKADHEKASSMQAYMKSTMPYHGVPSPVAKTIYKGLFKNFDVSDFDHWTKTVRDIWYGAKCREERYGALALAGHSNARIHHVFQALSLFEELIVDGAWWDYVDDLAIHRVGLVLENDPKKTKSSMLTWSKSPDIWKRRTSIICQISLNEKTDMNLLYKCILPSMASKEFFIRKAIGWALRQVAWQDPNEIIRYVKLNREKLSPLTKREALKNVIRDGKFKVIP